MSWMSFILRPMTSTKSSTRRKSSLMFGPSWENRDTWEQNKRKRIMDLRRMFWNAVRALDTQKAFYRKSGFWDKNCHSFLFQFSVTMSYSPHYHNHNQHEHLQFVSPFFLFDDRKYTAALFLFSILKKKTAHGSTECRWWEINGCDKGLKAKSLTFWLNTFQWCNICYYIKSHFF